MGVMEMLQESIEPLLHRYGVNLAFAGHLHEIQRQSAVYRGDVVQAAEIIPDPLIPGASVTDSPEPAYTGNAKHTYILHTQPTTNVMDSLPR